jgi:hypothetical protein
MKTEVLIGRRALPQSAVLLPWNGREAGCIADSRSSRRDGRELAAARKMG